LKCRRVRICYVSCILLKFEIAISELEQSDCIFDRDQDKFRLRPDELIYSLV
jgi:hypothetical protein